MAVANTSSFFLVVNSYYNTQFDPVPYTDEGLKLYTETFYKYLSFSQYGIYFDCSKEYFMQVFIDFLQGKGRYTTKYFAFIFLGHGSGGRLLMNDGQSVSIQVIIDEINKFVPEQVSKLFIINACRENEQLVLPKTPNSIYIYATLPGRKAIPAWSKYFNDELRTNAGDLHAVCFSACAKVKEYLNSNVEPSQYISNGLPAPKLLQSETFRLEIPGAILGRLTTYSQLMEQYRARDPSFGNVGQQPLLTPEASAYLSGGSKDSQHSNGGRIPPQNILPQNVPYQNMPPQNVPPQNVPLQNVPPQNVPPQNVPPQNVPPQNVPPQNVPPQNVPPQNVPPQNVPLQNVPPQNVPPQNVPYQNVPYQNVPHQNVPHQNVPPQNIPPQNVPLQNVPPQNVPPQNVPPQNVPLQNVPPQNIPPQNVPPQNVPPQNVPPQNVPPQNVPPQNVPPQNVPPQNVPPQNVPPQNVPYQNVPLQNVLYQNIPPQNIPPQNVPPQNVPPQNVPPQNVPYQNVPPQNVPYQNVPPQNVPPQNVPPQNVPYQNVPYQNVPLQNVLYQNIPPQNVPYQNVPPQNVPYQNVPPQNVPYQNVHEVDLNQSALPDPLLKLQKKAFGVYESYKLAEGDSEVTFVRLAIVKNKPSVLETKGDQLETLKRLRECGPKSENIDVKDLAKQCKDRRRIVYGQAGAGKTTAMKHICQQVALSQIKSDYALILFFPLRDESVSKCTDLPSLLEYYGEGSSEDTTKMLEEGKGRDTLLIFDGADEARELLQKGSNSVLLKLLEGKLLPEASIILSSRPGVCPELQKYVNQFYEVQGFDEVAIKAYVTEFFKDDPGSAERMLQTISDRPDLEGGAYIPMNLFIFCSTFKANEYSHPATITECYQGHVSELCSRECEKEGRDVYIDPTLSELPEDLQDLLRRLGELAFNGLTAKPSNYIFNEKAIRKVFPEIKEKPEDSLFKGLLQLHSGKPGFRPTFSGNFSHATLQEFFSALHLSPLSEKDQVIFWKEHIFNPSFAVVLRFYAGLTKLSCKDFIPLCLITPPATSTTAAPPNVAGATLQLPAKSDQQNPQLLILLHALHESQKKTIICETLKHLNSSLRFFNLGSFDAMVALNCLAHCTHLVELFMHGNRNPFPVESVKRLLHNNQKLQKLGYIVLDHLTEDDAVTMFTRITCSVKELDLNITKSTSVSAIMRVFSLKGLETLRLSLSGCTITESEGSSLEELVRSNLSLKEFRLYCSHAKRLSRRQFFDCLSIVTNLSSLEKCNVQLSELSERDAVTMFTRTCSVKELDLNIDESTSVSALIEVFSLKELETLSLYLRGCTKTGCEEEFESLKSAINNNSHLNKLAFRIHCNQMKRPSHSKCIECISQSRSINYLEVESTSGHDLVPVLEMVQLRRLIVRNTDPVPLLHSLKNRRDVLEELIFVIDWYFESWVETVDLNEMEVAYSAAKVKTLGVVGISHVTDLKKMAKAISAGISRNEHVQTVKSLEECPVQSSNEKHKNITATWGELRSL